MYIHLHVHAVVQGVSFVEPLQGIIGIYANTGSGVRRYWMSVAHQVQICICRGNIPFPAGKNAQCTANDSLDKPHIRRPRQGQLEWYCTIKLVGNATCNSVIFSPTAWDVQIRTDKEPCKVDESEALERLLL